MKDQQEMQTIIANLSDISIDSFQSVDEFFRRRSREALRPDFSQFDRRREIDQSILIPENKSDQ